MQLLRPRSLAPQKPDRSTRQGRARHLQIPAPGHLPGVKPTGKRVEVPLVVIVHFRGDKLAHEHIYWDQASVLVQLGLMDPSELPVMGIETAQKVLDNSIPSNALIDRAGAAHAAPLKHY